MERISRKKRKQRVSANKVIYFAAIIAIVILIVLVLGKIDKKKEVTISKIDFLDIKGNVYVQFEIKNPSYKQKTCLLNMIVADKRYGGYVNISARSEKSYKTLVDMPDGKTDVKLDYLCS